MTQEELLKMSDRIIRQAIEAAKKADTPELREQYLRGRLSNDGKWLNVIGNALEKPR